MELALTNRGMSVNAEDTGGDREVTTTGKRRCWSEMQTVLGLPGYNIPGSDHDLA